MTDLAHNESVDPLALSRADVARRLGLKSPRTVTLMVQRGELPEPDFRIGGHKPRWIPGRLVAWLEARADEAQEARDAS